jgi:hypothetical protein
MEIQLAIHSWDLGGPGGTSHPSSLFQNIKKRGLCTPQIINVDLRAQD